MDDNKDDYSKESLAQKSHSELEKEKLIQDILYSKKKDKDLDNSSRKERFYHILPAVFSSLVAIVAIVIGYSQKSQDIEANTDYDCMSYLKEYSNITDHGKVLSYSNILYNKIRVCFPNEELKAPNTEIHLVKKNIEKTSNMALQVKQSISHSVDHFKPDYSIDTQPIPYDKNTAASIADEKNIEGKHLENILGKKVKDELLNKVDTNAVDQLMTYQLSIASDKENIRFKTDVPTDDGVFWVKKGYFVDTEINGLKVYASNIDDKNSTADITIYTDHNKLNRDVTLRDTDNQRMYSFKHKKNRYKIIYNSIDFAGKNPFKKALYFTLQKYEVN